MKKTIALSIIAGVAGLMTSVAMAAKQELTLATFTVPKGADGSAGCSPEVTVVDSETPGCVVITTQNKERVSGNCVASGDPYTKTVCNGEKGPKGDDGSFDDTVTEVYQMPANCSGDVGSQNCAAAGYIKKMNGDTVLGTIADTCMPDKDRASSADAKATLRQKCTYPELAGVGYAGEVYYVGDAAPIQCVVETTSYAAPAADTKVAGTERTYTSVGKTTIERKDNCDSGVLTTYKYVDDICVLADFDETAENAYEYYECKPAGGGEAYTYRKALSNVVSKIKTAKSTAEANASALASKANVADVYTKSQVDTAIANVAPDVKLDYFEGQLQYCNDGADCYDNNEDPVTAKWTGVNIAGLNGTDGKNGCSVRIASKSDNETLSNGKTGTRLVLGQDCPTGVTPAADQTIELAYGDKGDSALKIWQETTSNPSGTAEQFLAALKGAPGNDGVTPQLQTAADGRTIQYKYGNGEWQNLVELSLTNLCDRVYSKSDESDDSTEIICCMGDECRE